MSTPSASEVIVAQMGKVLAGAKVRLGDEVACMSTLLRSDPYFTAPEIITHLPAAQIEAARLLAAVGA